MRVVKVSEHDHQVSLMRWIALSTPRYPVLGLIFAIPNGGARHIKVAAKLKAEGVKKGIPDLFFAYPARGYHGLFIELKTESGRVSKEQKEMIERLSKVGYKAVVCRGWEDAKDEILNYLGVHSGY